MVLSCLIYRPGELKISSTRKKNKLSLSSVAVVVAVVVLSSFYYVFGVILEYSNLDQFLLFIGITKVNISIFKYIYQICLNIERQSTVGFSVFNLLLDWLGCVVSVIQILLIYFALGNHNVNIGKFMLSVMCGLLDMVLMWQHFVTYKKARIAFEKRKNALLN